MGTPPLAKKGIPRWQNWKKSGREHAAQRHSQQGRTAGPVHKSCRPSMISTPRSSSLLPLLQSCVPSTHDHLRRDPYKPCTTRHPELDPISPAFYPIETTRRILYWSSWRCKVAQRWPSPALCPHSALAFHPSPTQCSLKYTRAWSSVVGPLSPLTTDS